MNQPAGETSNKSMKVGREGPLEIGSWSTVWRCDVTGPRSSGITSQQGRPSGRETRKEEGIEDRKEEITREMEEP